MKKLLVFLFLIAGFIGFAQGTIPSYPNLKLTKLPVGNKQDSVVVLTANKTLKQLPTSAIKGTTNLDYTATPTGGTVVSSTGNDATVPLATGTNAGLLDPADKVKINNLNEKEDKANKNTANGYAGLGIDGKLISSQLPSIVLTDTYVTASQAEMLALLAQMGDVAVRTDLNKSFILKGTDPTVLSDWQELLSPTSEVTTVFGRNGAITAQTGDYTADQITETATGKFQTANQKAYNDATSSIQTQLDSKAPLASPTFTGTVSGITKTMVGLGNVDNTSDANKPVSTATQAALNLKADLASPTFTGTVSGITKTMVGLGNVDNTSDLNKPISTATQTALDLKANDSNVVHLSGAETIPGQKTFTDILNASSGVNTKTSFYNAQNNYDASSVPTISNRFDKLWFFNGDNQWGYNFNASALTVVRSYNLPDIAGTIALTSDLSAYEPVFSKNTAFNKNFGTATGTVAEGNDGRILNGQTAYGWGNHSGLYSPNSGSTNYIQNQNVLAQTANMRISGQVTASELISSDIRLNKSTDTGAIDKMVVGYSGDGVQHWSAAPQIQSWLGLGSNAYTSVPLDNMFSNDGTTFISKYNSISDGHSRSGTVYNASDQPLGTGLYNVFMTKWSGAYGSILAINTEPSTGDIYTKTLYGGTWGSWKTFLNSGNFNVFSPTLTGTGATGTWGINVSGNSASASNWGNRPADFDTNASDLTFLIGRGTDDVNRNVSSDLTKSWLGLGSNAYTSTAFLPLTGGTLTGSFNSTYNQYGYASRSVPNFHSKQVGSADDYIQHVILLHPVYNGALINYNQCDGIITKRRGGIGNGLSTGSYKIKTSTGYNSQSYALESTSGGNGELYTCNYNGVKYVALMTDYSTAGVEYGFDGYMAGDANSLLVVGYRNSQTSVVLNSEINNSLTLITSCQPTNVKGAVNASSFVTNGGTSSQFLKADGSSDGTDYAPLSSPSFTGTPIAPTPTTPNGIANKSYVDNAVIASGATSGTYTPTFTGVSNVTSYSLNSATYTKIGNIVHVSISVNMQPTATSSNTQLNFTVPFSSTSSAGSGIFMGQPHSGLVNKISSAEAYIYFTAVNVFNQSFHIQYDYELL